jgi:hypothetical protein
MTALFYNGLQAKSDKSGVIFRIGDDGNVYAEDSNNSGDVIVKQAGVSMTNLVASNFGSVGTERLMQYPDGKYIRTGFYSNGWTAKVKLVDNKGIFKVTRVS